MTIWDVIENHTINHSNYNGNCYHFKIIGKGGAQNAVD